MLVLRTYYTGWGGKVTKDMTPAESSELSREGMESEQPDCWSDPSYHWARDARRARKRKRRG
jgi:hypothetical protein